MTAKQNDAMRDYAPRTSRAMSLFYTGRGQQHGELAVDWRLTDTVTLVACTGRRRAAKSFFFERGRAGRTYHVVPGSVLSLSRV